MDNTCWCRLQAGGQRLPVVLCSGRLPGLRAKAEVRRPDDGAGEAEDAREEGGAGAQPKEALLADEEEEEVADEKEEVVVVEEEELEEDGEEGAEVVSSAGEGAVAEMAV